MGPSLGAQTGIPATKSQWIRLCRMKISTFRKLENTYLIDSTEPHSSCKKHQIFLWHYFHPILQGHTVSGHKERKFHPSKTRYLGHPENKKMLAIPESQSLTMFKQKQTRKTKINFAIKSECFAWNPFTTQSSLQWIVSGLPIIRQPKCPFFINLKNFGAI